MNRFALSIAAAAALLSSVAFLPATADPASTISDSWNTSVNHVPWPTKPLGMFVGFPLRVIGSAFSGENLGKLESDQNINSAGDKCIKATTADSPSIYDAGLSVSATACSIDAALEGHHSADTATAAPANSNGATADNGADTTVATN